mmetsp:Transcript_36329/g.86835  ORF Transcript_36329/g.86835 Transcript_36329/m.86835 type:complete len:301 (-) Transcript_36329:467-1369(-)
MLQATAWRHRVTWTRGRRVRHLLPRQEPCRLARRTRAILRTPAVSARKGPTRASRGGDGGGAPRPSSPGRWRCRRRTLAGAGPSGTDCAASDAARTRPGRRRRRRRRRCSGGASATGDYAPQSSSSLPPDRHPPPLLPRPPPPPHPPLLPRPPSPHPKPLRSLLLRQAQAQTPRHVQVALCNSNVPHRHRQHLLQVYHRLARRHHWFCHLMLTPPTLALVHSSMPRLLARHPGLHRGSRVVRGHASHCGGRGPCRSAGPFLKRHLCLEQRRFQRRSHLHVSPRLVGWLQMMHGLLPHLQS